MKANPALRRRTAPFWSALAALGVAVHLLLSLIIATLVWAGCKVQAGTAAAMKHGGGHGRPPHARSARCPPEGDAPPPRERPFGGGHA